jgi:hypothetical protein
MASAIRQRRRAAAGPRHLAGIATADRKRVVVRSSPLFPDVEIPATDGIGHPALLDHTRAEARVAAAIRQDSRFSKHTLVGSPMCGPKGAMRR